MPLRSWVAPPLFFPANFFVSQFCFASNDLPRIVRDGRQRGFVFISDQDARPAGAAHPDASLWDNGKDAVAELDRVIAVRERAIANFGIGNLAEGLAADRLHELFVPVYRYHRFQVAAAAKSLGGVRYSYSINGDGNGSSKIVDRIQQSAALDNLLKTLQPRFLDIPEHLQEVLLPRLFGNSNNREMLLSSTSPTFDALGASATAAEMTLVQIFEPARCGRLVEHHLRDASMPSLESVVSYTVAHLFDFTVKESERHHAIRQRAQYVLVEQLIDLAQDDQAQPMVRAIVNNELRRLQAEMKVWKIAVDVVHHQQMSMLIEGHLNRPAEDAPPTRSSHPEPPGSPIGNGSRYNFGCGDAMMWRD